MSEAIMKHQNKRAKKSARTISYTLKVTEVGEIYKSSEILTLMRETPTPDTRLGRVPTNWIPATASSLAHKMRQHPAHWRMIPKNEENKSAFLWERLS